VLSEVEAHWIKPFDFAQGENPVTPYSALAKRAFLFVLYTIGGIFCHRFMQSGYDYFTCEVNMNRLDVNSPAFTLSPPSYSRPEAGRRLIVLVSESEADIPGAARRIWELASAFGCRIQFLGLCKDQAYEPSLRRQIIALSTMVGDGRLSVESKIEFGSNWLDVVKSNSREGDVIACFAEQNVGFAKRPLSQILESSLGTTVYVLSGFYQPESPRLTWLPSATMWAGAVGIIAGFFWVQAKLIQLPQDWAHTILLYASILVEFGLVVFWNSLF
jgi:hypothetical protein